MKRFKGKAIYQSDGRAAEFSAWACNFYTGCSNNCAYCYCKRGVLARTWSETPKLKTCFKDENHALWKFDKELKANLPELQKHGLFFSFTTDPMLPEVAPFTVSAINFCVKNEVPAKILTKRADWDVLWNKYTMCKSSDIKRLIAFGFTLTGHDEFEPGASPNLERIEAMRELHKAGFKTWASLEPVIDFSSSVDMIVRSMEFCDMYKIGLLRDASHDKKLLKTFVRFVYCMQKKDRKRIKVYFKDDLLRQAGICREELPENCVGREYNMFNS